MGAADAVPGVSGGTIAFITGIYEELINTIKQFGPSAWPAWRQDGLRGLARHLNLSFLVPLLVGIAISLISVAHLVVWLMEVQPLVLNGFFFGLVAASALIIGQHVTDRRWWHVLPVIGGLVLAYLLPSLMPFVASVGRPELVLVLGGAIAISALLLPGVSGSFLLLTMGLYGTVMQAIRGFELTTLVLFASGCAFGLFFFSRLLSWLLKNHHGATLQLLLGFIIGSLPVLWPWRELMDYQLSNEGQVIPLGFRYLGPQSYSQVTGEPGQLVAVVVAIIAGGLLVWLASKTGRPAGSTKRDNKESNDA
ncbi:DUF368 domain-containing protein [Halomonas halocynthiae]|uniref:DUF368 domain-containing protein n=1 Tax=Halomonas halocynthiae TaxID=176290 RepID=UPI000420C89C